MAAAAGAVPAGLGGAVGSGVGAGAGALACGAGPHAASIAIPAAEPIVRKAARRLSKTSDMLADLPLVMSASVIELVASDAPSPTCITGTSLLGQPVAADTG